MSALVVDWLGRGGIAQTTTAWMHALRDAGHGTTVVTRRGRELGDCVTAPTEAVHPLVTHRRLAALAAATIEQERPDLVVIQNYVVPPLETALDRALARTRTPTIVVIHDHQLHSPVAGTRAGLRRRIRRADLVVTHSQFVADAVRTFSGRPDITTVPLPLPLGMQAARGTSVLPASSDATALLFGVVKRGYKGIDVVRTLAAEGVDGWRLAAAGVGAPTDAPGLVGIDGFIPGPDLAATVDACDAVILPYRMASQSAAVVLAQAHGTLPIAAAVGGIPEQITSGVDGVLVPSGATTDQWRRAIESTVELGADARTAARDRVAAGNRAFYEAIRAVA